jgi:hypothetical protein
MIETQSFVLEREYNPVHSDPCRKIQSHSETGPNAGQYGCMFPVIVA